MHYLQYDMSRRAGGAGSQQFSMSNSILMMSIVSNAVLSSGSQSSECRISSPARTVSSSERDRARSVRVSVAVEPLYHPPRDLGQIDALETVGFVRRYGVAGGGARAVAPCVPAGWAGWGVLGVGGGGAAEVAAR